MNTTSHSHDSAIEEASKRKRESSIPPEIVATTNAAEDAISHSKDNISPNASAPPKKSQRAENSSNVSSIRRKVEKSRIDDDVKPEDADVVEDNESIDDDLDEKQNDDKQNGNTGNVMQTQTAEAQIRNKELKTRTAAEKEREDAVPASPPKRAKIFGFGASTSSSSPFGTVKSAGSSFLDKPSNSPAQKVITGFGDSTSAESPFRSVAKAKPAFGSSTGSESPFGSVAKGSSATFGSSTSSTSPFGSIANDKPTNAAKSSFASSTSATSPFGTVATAPKSSIASPAPPVSNKGFGTFGSKYSGATFGSVTDTDKQQTTTASSWLSEPTKARPKREKSDDDADDDEEEVDDEDEEESSQLFSTPQVSLQEQEIVTGEENEDTLYSAKCKLFVLSEGAWKERGGGTVRLNKPKPTTGSRTCRLVMRADTTYRLILNVRLHAAMAAMLAQEKFVRFMAFENAKPVQFAFRTTHAEVAKTIYEQLSANIPAADDKTAQKPSA